jgi:hypothetical protein
LVELLQIQVKVVVFLQLLLLVLQLVQQFHQLSMKKQNSEFYLVYKNFTFGSPPTILSAVVTRATVVESTCGSFTSTFSSGQTLRKKSS